MADTTISTSRQSCEPDYCDQLTQIDRQTMNKYSEIDESPSSDTEDQDQDQGKSVESNAVEQPLSLTNMIENKLKRKKKLSTSLTSVSEAVNQEKRTRIEGIQLNCRGKLNEDLIAAATRSKSPSPAPQQQTQVRMERVLAPQPSPKVAEKIILLQQQCHRAQSQSAQQSAKVPPPRLKRKLEENVSIIQKLNAQTEQMRLEIAELKTHLTAERGAVRVLRAQNESETRKWKTEVKKLQTAMELMRKVKKSKEEACANWPAANSSNSSSAHGAKDATISNHELQRLTNEIKTLREANRTLEEKLQISNDAERRKAADLRELKDSYEIRLTQLSKSAKTEISRLLEEIKTKERNIGQLKRETQTLQKHKTNQTTNHNKKDTHPRNAAQHPIEMKKLKDIERNKNIINNNCNVTNKINTNNEKRFINTTCGEKEFHSMPHEITERILEAHNDVHAYGSKQDHQNSDSDSALSSAPPSISPQPPPTGMEPTDIWQTIRNYTKDLEKVQNELESIRKENETLQKELKLAKIQIKESEKTALDATNTAKLQQQQQQQLQERIKYLEQRENELQEETHELREQNELLEFRILELEESNDKWSLQSNTTVNNKNVWSNSGKESEDAIIFTDRSDSGVTSPHSHHHIDDRMNAISPCDLNLLDHIRTEDLRRHLSQMIKKPNFDEDDRMCLQHVLAFIQNVDVMSHDSLPSSEESSSLEYIKSRVSDYDSSSRSSDVSPTLIVQKPKLAPSPVAGRIVATVLPYSSTVSTPNESPQRKLRAWNTSSLTESGVFEGDLSESSVQTQTEPEDFACLEAAAATKDLCTEIQKLNRFREKFEECFAKSPYTKVPVPSLPSLSPNLSDQKRIQFYKDRLDVLESKLLIYESSGDLQAKRLADRLQREIQLENLVKELQDRVDFLEVENAQLEEEKCEFEEAENDTRLRLQRLEVELEILSQRNIELEMSREALQNKLKDCRSESAILRDDLAASQTQICHLEEDRCRYKENFEFLHSAIPALILFNIFCVTTDMGNTLDADEAPIAERYDHAQKAGSPCDCSTKDQALRRESQNLREEVRSLKRQIGDLNSRHAEALTCADGFWEGMERDYNEKLMASKAKEEFLKQKIKQLEGCLEDDSRAANEKINQLEDAERELKYCLQRVSRDHREILKEHDLIREENQQLKEEYGKLKDRFEGPFKQAMEREKVQNKNLKEELGYMRRVSCEQEMHYRNELDCFQVQLDKLQKEFMQIQVTNSELKEEVCTLEKELVYLHEQKRDDLDKIRCLSDEVRTKEDVCALLEKRLEALLGAPYHMGKAGPYHPKAAHVNAAPSLAQELSGSPVKRIRMEEPNDLRTATKNLGAVLSSMKETNAIPSHKQFQSVANDVKKLADTLLAERSASVEVSQASEESGSDTGKPTRGEKPFDEIGSSAKLQGQPPVDRTRPTQNDRDRDHSNLSNQPNTEACAGQTQPSAGRHSNRHAKDNNDTCYDNNDHSDDDEEDEDEREDDSKDGHTRECRTTRNGVFTDHCDGSCTRRRTDEDAKPTGPHSTVKLLAEICDNRGIKLKESSGEDIQSKEKQDAVKTRVDEAQSSELSDLTTECPQIPPPAVDEGSQTKEDCRRIEAAAKSESEDHACMPQSSSEMLTPRPCRREHLHETNCVEVELPPSEPQGAGQPSSESATTSFLAIATHSETTDKARTADQILPLLQSIYDVVRSMRDEKLSPTAPRVNVRDPPWTSRKPLRTGEELCHVTDSSRPRLTTDKLDTETMALLEPPERDTDCTSSSKPRRRVPVDMELFRTIDWEMQQSVEATFQRLPTLSSNQLDPQPGQDDFTSAATEAEAFLKSTACLDFNFDTPALCKDVEIKPNAAQFLQRPAEKPHGREDEENSKRTAQESPPKTSFATATCDQPNITNVTIKPQFLVNPKGIEEEHKASPDLLRSPPSTSDVGTDRPDFADEPCCCSMVCTNRQADILETMQAVRSNAKYHFSSISPCHGRWRSTSADLSFPASIEQVHELGRNSLFVKWKVHSLKNVAGYEILLDGTLTNRYYSRIHRAAVICNVDLEYPHRIILRALPPAPKRFSQSSKSSITSIDRPLATTTPGACCPKTNDTAIWYPSVYHFEPTLSPATVSFDYNGCCASQS